MQRPHTCGNPKGQQPHGGQPPQEGKADPPPTTAATDPSEAAPPTHSPKQTHSPPAGPSTRHSTATTSLTALTAPPPMANRKTRRKPHAHNPQTQSSQNPASRPQPTGRPHRGTKAPTPRSCGNPGRRPLYPPAQPPTCTSTRPCKHQKTTPYIHK